MHARSRSRRRAGFTLIEVLLVLAILVILSTLAVGMFTNTQKKANVKAARTQIGLFQTPMEEYHLDLNRYPSALDDLVKAPSDLANPAKWGGSYLKGTELPSDPWGNPFRYAAPGTHDPQGYDVWSVGPDGVDGTEDDIGSWQK